jgi:hypothetical protein
VARGVVVAAGQSSAHHPVPALLCTLCCAFALESCGALPRVGVLGARYRHDQGALVARRVRCACVSGVALRGAGAMAVTARCVNECTCWLGVFGLSLARRLALRCTVAAQVCPSSECLVRRLVRAWHFSCSAPPPSPPPPPPPPPPRLPTRPQVHMYSTHPPSPLPEPACGCRVTALSLAPHCHPPIRCCCCFRGCRHEVL